MNVIGRGKIEQVCRTWRLAAAMAGIICLLCGVYPAGAKSQPNRGAGAVRTIAAGASISVRNSETIDVKKNDGGEFSAAVYQDVLDENGDIAIPKGTYATLIVKPALDGCPALDLEWVEVSGVRYTVGATGADKDQPRGLKTAARTGNSVDGAKLVHAIAEVLGGGGGGAFKIPAESFLTFRLERPLDVANDAQ